MNKKSYLHTGTLFLENGKKVKMMFSDKRRFCSKNRFLREMIFQRKVFSAYILKVKVHTQKIQGWKKVYEVNKNAK